MRVDGYGRYGKFVGSMEDMDGNFFLVSYKEFFERVRVVGLFFLEVSDVVVKGWWLVIK